MEALRAEAALNRALEKPRTADRSAFGLIYLGLMTDVISMFGRG